MNYSIEKIFHFVCINCQLWWSIATENMKMDKKSMTCPHCKHVHLPPHKDTSMYIGPGMNSLSKRGIE